MSSCAVLAAAATLLIAPAAPAAPLEAEAPILLPGTHGKFDFITIDPVHRRLLAAHTGNGSLDVIDLDQKALLKAVPVGAAQACAVDARGERYLVSVSKPPQLAIVDAARLEVSGTVPLAGPADLLAWHEPSGTAYVCHDDDREVWAVSPAAGKVTGSIALSSDSPEDLHFDAAGKRLFQAMKTAATVDVIDVASGKVTATWPVAPAKLPHGMATVPEAGALLVAGGNGMLVLLSQTDGHLLATAEMPTGVDEIAYDEAQHRAYCASSLGKIAVYQVAAGGLTSLGEVASSPGARSIAVDPQTHAVWIAYAKEDVGCVQAFTARP